MRIYQNENGEFQLTEMGNGIEVTLPSTFVKRFHKIRAEWEAVQSELAVLVQIKTKKESK